MALHHHNSFRLALKPRNSVKRTKKELSFSQSLRIVLGWLAPFLLTTNINISFPHEHQTIENQPIIPSQKSNVP
jgi:hypothetical protein